MNVEEQQQNIPPVVVNLLRPWFLEQGFEQYFNNIMATYNNMGEFHNLGNHQLGGNIIILRDLRQAFFGQSFLSQQDCHTYLRSRAVMDVTYFYRLYLLLIYTRVMDVAIHVLLNREVIPVHELDLIYRRDHIVEEGIRLCHRLNLILAVVQRFPDFDVTNTFVLQMAEHFEQRRVLYNYEDIVPTLRINQVPDVQDIPQPGIQNLHPEAANGIIGVYQRMNEFHMLNNEGLSQFFVDSLHSRDLYFGECFPGLINQNFRVFIANGAVTSHYHFYVLYFLLIYTRIIEEQMRLLSLRQITFNEEYTTVHILEDGMELCFRLNDLFILNPNFRPQGYDVLTNFVRRIGQYFIDRAEIQQIVVGHTDFLQEQLLELVYFPLHLNLENVRPEILVLVEFHRYTRRNQYPFEFLTIVIDYITHQRDLYFNLRFGIPYMTFEQYIVSGDENHGILTNEEYCLVLYFLLIFCRLIDCAFTAMHVHLNAHVYPNYEQRNQMSITVGRRLCELLNAIINGWTNAQRLERQRMIDFVVNMRIRFELRFAHNAQPMVQKVDLPLDDIQKDDIQKDDIQKDDVPEDDVSEDDVPPAQQLPENPDVGVDDTHADSPNYAVVAEWAQFLDIRNLNNRDLAERYNAYTNARIEYFKQRFPDADVNNPFLLHGNIPTDPDHIWHYYFILIFSRLIAEVVDTNLDRKFTPRWRERRSDNVKVGVGMAQRLTHIITNVWDDAERQHHNVVVVYVNTIGQYFENLRQALNINIP